MSVRRANHVDTPALVRIMERALDRSIYKGVGTFDELTAKSLIAQSIQRHGHTNLGGCLVLVSEHESEIKGFIIGVIDHVYPGYKERMATDLLFLCEEGTPPGDPATMLKELAEWGLSGKDVIEIHLGVSGAIGDPERTAKLYERAGFKRCGAMFRMERGA